MPNHIQGVPSRFVQAVRNLEDDYYMREEVARMLDVAPSTLKAWGERNPELGPYGYAQIENRIVYLYRLEDVVALREYQLQRYPMRANGQRTRRRGRPKMWSREEMEDRDSRQRRIAYLLKRARLAEAQGAEHRQLDLLAEVEQIRERLHEEYRVRFAEVTRPRVHGDWLASHMQLDSVS